MPSPWSAGLVEFGKAVRSVKDELQADKDRKKKEEEEKRKAAMAEIMREDAGMTLDLRKKALSDFERWKTDTGSAKKTQSALDTASGISMSPDMKTEEAGPSSPLPAGQYDTVNRDTALAKKAPLESMRDYGVLSGAGYDKGVAAAVESEKIKDKERSGGGVLGSYYELKKRDATDYVNTVFPNASEAEKVEKVMNILRAPAGTYRHSDTGIKKEQELTTKRKLATLTPEIQEQEVGLTGKKAATSASSRIKAEDETKQGIPGTYKQSQYTAAGFANRMEQAESTLDELFKKGFDPGSFYNMIKSPDAMNAIKDPEQQKYAQAMRNFINATLRRESGAAIAPSEFDSANKQYFAQLNDSPEVLAQKRENRLRQFDAFMTEAGGAYKQVKGQGEKRRAEAPAEDQPKASTIQYKGKSVPSYDSEEDARKAGAKGTIHIKGMGIGVLE